MIVPSIYRPFINKYLYLDRIITHRLYQNLSIFGLKNRYSNICIAFSGPGSSKPFQVLVQNVIYSLDLLEKTQCLPLYWYENGEKRDNITDWGLAQFVNYYSDDTITKEGIFNYTYAVLHDPAYREKYKIDLKRDFPRLPFYTDFWQWVEWGKKLMELHLNFETVEPFPLTEVTKNEDETVSSSGIQPKNKTRLTTEKVNGTIVLDDVTTLTGVPPQAWEYKLGNRSTLEWILDQYKEKKPKDPTIAEKFNNYKFADHKTKVIDLLKRVTTVSVETMKIIEEMKGKV
jgi:predicted helicase